jgi:cytoskeletal protein CcmA (bactofilin family)
MLGFNRSTDLRDGVKAPLKPALYDPPGAPAKAVAGAPPARPAPLAPAPAPAPARDAKAAPNAPPHEGAAHAVATAAESADLALTDAPGSKLFIGVNIKLKGVEISDCDVLVIEGEVDATVHSKLMQIAPPGTLHGTALIDVAEIHGEFAGELTARTRLVVHGTGRVSGTIRYGKLIIAEGGELSGDVKRLDPANEQPQRSLLPASHSRPAPAAGAAAGPGWTEQSVRPG